MRINLKYPTHQELPSSGLATSSLLFQHFRYSGRRRRPLEAFDCRGGHVLNLTADGRDAKAGINLREQRGSTKLCDIEMEML